MTKSTRNIIIIAAVIVLLAAGIIVLNTIDFSEEEESVSATSEPLYTVYSEETSDLLSVTVETADMTLTANNLGESVWTINNMSNDDIDKSKAYTLASTVSTIISKNKIEENVSDFAQYGLDKPTVTVTVRGRDGGENILYVGDMSPTLGEYFIRLNDEKTVYTMYSYKVDTLMKPLSYYSDFNRFSVNADDIINIIIERDGETIELKIADDIEQTTNDVWELVRPYKSSANDEYIDNNILAELEGLTLNTLAPEGGSYGTDEPTAKITLTVKPYDNTTGKYGDEYKETFVVGKIENNKAYVEYNGKIFETSEESLDFVDTPVFNILNKLQALVDISRVKAFTVKYDNVSDKTQITGSGSNMTFELNGTSVPAKTARSAYQTMISLAVDGIYKGEKLGETVLELDFEGIKKDDSVKVEFKPINDLSCALVRNGQADFTIKKNKLDEFISSWKKYVNEITNGGNENE